MNKGLLNILLLTFDEYDNTFNNNYIWDDNSNNDHYVSIYTNCIFVQFTNMQLNSFIDTANELLEIHLKNHTKLQNINIVHQFYNEKGLYKSSNRYKVLFKAGRYKKSSNPDIMKKVSRKTTKAK
jgi:hypothetical protein